MFVKLATRTSIAIPSPYPLAPPNGAALGTQVKGALDSVHAPTKGDIFIVIQPNSSDPITVVNA